ncbi:MAG: pilus assembly FimT family protein [Myxococcota bacterium]
MIKEIRERGASGFSLVELMIVVSIIAILAALAAPSVSQYIEHSKGREVARSVANSVRYARDQATSRGEVVLIELDPTASDGRGIVRVLRLVDSSGSSGGDTGSGTDAGGSTTGVSMPKSCKEASWKLDEGTVTAETVYEYDVGQEQPDMAIREVDPSPNDPMRICAMPDGRVGTMTGLPFTPTSASGGCTDQEIRIGVALEGEDLSPAFGSNALGDCVEDDPGADPNPRQQLKDSRDLVNYWMITVSYNGSVDASQ